MAMGARQRILVYLLLLGMALPVRLWLVSTWHASAGDGIDYFSLSQELSRDGRFAYGPPPVSESYARMPGYPLFLAYAAVRKAPLSLETHLIRATRANVVLDVLTAVLVLLLLGECERGAGRNRGLGLPRFAQAIGFGLALFYPLQLLLSTYALSESLATFLATLEMYLALRAMRTRLLLHATLCGIVAGAAQLVRLDALVVAPAVGLAILYAAAPWRRRLVAVGLFLAMAGLVFSPWPLRNWQRFGQPHISGAYLRLRVSGQPLPDGVISWARTWATGAPGESALDLALSLGWPLNPYSFPLAPFDDPTERQDLAEIIAHYNQEGLSARVDLGFRNLAKKRFWNHPLRVLLLLPLRRFSRLWAPLPDIELPLRIPQLKLPERRPLLGRVDHGLYVLAIFGAFVLWQRRGGGRRRLYIFGAAILGRSLLYSFAVPNAVNQRFLVEALPLLFVLAAAAFAAIARGGISATHDDTGGRYEAG